jgi:hypothetical protein
VAYYIVSHANIFRITALAESLFPRVQFAGEIVQYKKDLQVAFGDNIKACMGTNNTVDAQGTAWSS